VNLTTPNLVGNKKSNSVFESMKNMAASEDSLKFNSQSDIKILKITTRGTVFVLILDFFQSLIIAVISVDSVLAHQII